MGAALACVATLIGRGLVELAPHSVLFSSVNELSLIPEVTTRDLTGEAGSAIVGATESSSASSATGTMLAGKSWIFLLMPGGRCGQVIGLAWVSLS